VLSPATEGIQILFKDVLEVDPRIVCATNLIFQRSRGERDAGGWELAKTCWPVHDVILKIVQPRVIITFGRLPFEFIWEKLSGTHPTAERSGHGSWQWRSSKLETEQVLIGVPHLSRYALQTKVNEDVRRLLGLPPRSTT
jgi:uracil-DNA glycosylase